MRDLDKNALDRHITGNYGEDQFRDVPEDDEVNIDGEIAARLEYLRSQIRAESISWGEVHELQGLADYIDSGDTELLEWAGVPEFAPESREVAATVVFKFETSEPEDSYMDALTADLFKLGERYEWTIREVVDPGGSE